LAGRNAGKSHIISEFWLQTCGYGRPLSTSVTGPGWKREAEFRLQIKIEAGFCLRKCALPYLIGKFEGRKPSSGAFLPQFIGNDARSSLEVSRSGLEYSPNLAGNRLPVSIGRGYRIWVEVVPNPTGK
jgi:hypothetical protein